MTKDECCFPWTLIPAIVMAVSGFVSNDPYLAFGGLAAFALMWELCEIKKILKNSCWY